MSGTRFSLPYRWIHWIMALIIAVMLIFGQRFGGELPDADRIFSLKGHASLGAIVVVLLIVRLFLRLTGRSGRPQHDINPLQDMASKVVQLGIYILLVYLPVTGFLTARVHALPVQPFGAASISLSDPARFEMLRPWHEYGTKALILLLVLHIGAALLHRFVQKDGVMAAMSLLRQKG